MAVRFSRGYFIMAGAYAVNDFQAMAVGETNTLFGEVEAGGVTLGTAFFLDRS